MRCRPSADRRSFPLGWRWERVTGVGLRSLLVAVAVLSCARSAQVRYEEALDETPPAGRHAIHDTRLRELMRGMDELAGERLPKSIDPAELREQRGEVVAEIARSVAESADQIRALGPAETLDAEARARFQGWVDALRQSALDLAEAAPTASPELLRERAATMHATCEGCHADFRIPLDPRADRPDGASGP